MIAFNSLFVSVLEHWKFFPISFSIHLKIYLNWLDARVFRRRCRIRRCFQWNADKLSKHWRLTKRELKLKSAWGLSFLQKVSLTIGTDKSHSKAFCPGKLLFKLFSDEILLKRQIPWKLEQIDFVVVIKWVFSTYTSAASCRDKFSTPENISPEIQAAGNLCCSIH